MHRSTVKDIYIYITLHIVNTGVYWRGLFLFYFILITQSTILERSLDPRIIVITPLP